MPGRVVRPTTFEHPMWQYLSYDPPTNMIFCVNGTGAGRCGRRTKGVKWANKLRALKHVSKCCDVPIQSRQQFTQEWQQIEREKAANRATHQQQLDNRARNNLVEAQRFREARLMRADGINNGNGQKSSHTSQGGVNLVSMQGRGGRGGRGGRSGRSGGDGGGDGGDGGDGGGFSGFSSSSSSNSNRGIRKFWGATPTPRSITDAQQWQQGDMAHATPSDIVSPRFSSTSSSSSSSSSLSLASIHSLTRANVQSHNGSNRSFETAYSQEAQEGKLYFL